MKRVGVMGFIHESNTFAVTPTTYKHFEQVSLTRGRGLIERWTGGNHELSGFLEGRPIQWPGTRSACGGLRHAERRRCPGYLRGHSG